MKKFQLIEQVTLGKYVHGGQCLAHTAEGKPVFVWGGLPGETVDVRIIRKKSSMLEGVVENVHVSSVHRITPIEPESYLGTSPWQIVSYDYENESKQAILAETFSRAGMHIEWSAFRADDQDMGYRNKMEWGFWADDNGISLAHFSRGSHQKVVVDSSALAKPEINTSASELVAELNRLRVEGRALKSVIIRTSEAGTVAALFVKTEEFPTLSLPKSLSGLTIYFSDPCSPASVPTRLMYEFGENELYDTIRGVKIHYGVLSFFQVHLPIFHAALEQISEWVKNDACIDMYSGVGTIGIPLAGVTLLIESEEANVVMARKNIADSSIELIHAPGERALEHITGEYSVIVDPPRAGLHDAVVERLLEVTPKRILYLSCNPSTQVRDCMKLAEKYNVVYAQGFNFFPRTPHIESLIVLELK